MFYPLSFGKIVLNRFTPCFDRKYKKRQLRDICIIENVTINDKCNFSAGYTFIAVNMKLVCIWHKTWERLAQPDLSPSFYVPCTQNVYFKTLL